MDGGIGGGEHAAFATKTLVPAFLVEVHIHWVDDIEEARVPDVQLVGGDTDDGAWDDSISDAYIQQNTALALAARALSSWAAEVPWPVFLYDVLPYAR